MSTIAPSPDAVAAVAPRQAEAFTERRLSRLIGSEISGIDLKRHLSPETVTALKHRLFDRGVLLFRDQHLDTDQHIAFTARFGEVRGYDGGAPRPMIWDSRKGIHGRVARWHTDGTHVEAPATINTINPIVLPEGGGGDTIWASTTAAYDRLSPPLQRLAEKLVAIHATTPLVARDWPRGFGGRFVWSEHPVVTVHPTTGARALFVNPRYTPEIKGLRPNESADLLKMLFNHITLPEHQVRITWEPGSLVMWDNRITQHYAVDDYGDDVRIIHNVGARGEARVGLNGLRSRLGAEIATEDLV
ncbi:MAG: TauD/TfdA dioxygenase family protein [Sphingobium sp.]